MIEIHKWHSITTVTQLAQYDSVTQMEQNNDWHSMIQLHKWHRITTVTQLAQYDSVTQMAQHNDCHTNITKYGKNG